MVLVMRLLMGRITEGLTQIVRGNFVLKRLVFVVVEMLSLIVVLAVMRGGGMLVGMEMLKTRQMRCWNFKMLTVRSSFLA